MKHFTIAAFIILCCAACTYKSQKVVLLRLKYFKGQNIDIKYRNYIVADDQEQPITNEYVRMGLTINSIMNDSLYNVSAKYDYVRTEGDGLMSEENYSSDKEESYMSPREKMLHQRFKPFLDSTYKFTMSNRGALVSPFAYANGLTIANELLLIDYGVYQIVFPTDSLGIGDAWKNASSSAVRGTRRESTYYIESIYDETIQIKVAGKLTAANGRSNKFTGRYYLNKGTNKLDSVQIEMEGKTFLHDKAKAVTSVIAH